MATASVTLSPTQEKPQPCPCGCAPCEKECCQLDCLVQPRFFCGQLLTDHDLTALLDWTKDRLRLGRFRYGWGAVCGLQVTRHPNGDGKIVVSPGYAVGCCGDPIVVCTEDALDVGRVCGKAEDECADLSGGTYPSGEVCAFDLVLNYHAEPTEPKTALARSVCHQTAQCEYSRTRETHRLALRKVSLDGATQPTTGDAPTYSDWLGEPIALDPGTSVSELYPAMMEHDRLSQELTMCHSCGPDHSVPLARIWVRVNSTTCELVMIDSSPPYRRALSLDGPWPVQPGSVNLLQFLWRRWDHVGQEIRAALTHAGATNLQVQVQDWQGAPDRLNNTPMLFSGNAQPVTVFTADLSGTDNGMPDLGERVVGFEIG